MNALEFGFYAKKVLLIDEDKEEFEAFARAYFDDLKPETASSTVMCWEIIHAAWDCQRFRRIERAYLDHHIKVEVMDRKFAIEDSCMSIGDQKIRGWAETRDLLETQGKELVPTETDSEHARAEMFENRGLDKHLKMAQMKERLLNRYLRLLREYQRQDDREIRLRREHRLIDNSEERIDKPRRETLGGSALEKNKTASKHDLGQTHGVSKLGAKTSSLTPADMELREWNGGDVR